jgi:2-amino-4-hydroxy-6-hydroxymethyldihydropteridine diphosphokinase
MNTAYLLTGGNIENRLKYINAAKTLINNYCGKVHAASAVYETEPWGLTAQETYLNQALLIKTRLQAQELLKKILQIEEEMGRKREVKFGPRKIDIDILLFNNDVINDENLHIPHPQLHNRRFALQCLKEIGPDEIHPIIKLSISDLLKHCTDPLKVEIYRSE